MAIWADKSGNTATWRSSGLRFTFCAVLLALAPGLALAETGEVTRPRVKVTRAVRVAVAPEIRITGDIQARYQSEISFRTSGKMSERLVEVGAHVAPDDILARLDRQEQVSNVADAEARLNSARALLAQAEQTFERQQTLITSGFTTRTAFDQAEQVLRTTQSQVEFAKAALGTVQEQLSYTDLRAGVAGIVTARNAETGQVVQAGQTIFTIAQDGSRDAVFNVYEALLATPPASREIEVVLQSNPSVRAGATVREISPTSDTASGTVKVKATLGAIPPGMTLRAVVIGIGQLASSQAIVLPWSAMFRWQGRPAVWVVDAKNVVDPHPVTVDRYDSDRIVIGAGIESGARIVSAGVQFLRPGQTVTVAEEITP